MAAIYSTQLLVLQGLTSSLGPLEFTVAPGQTVVVRDINAYTNNDAVTEGDLYWRNRTIGNTLYRWHSSAGGFTVAFWVGRQVFPAGQTFSLEVTAGTWDVQASGYLFQS